MPQADMGTVHDPSFCVIVPMYNEQSGAEDCVRAVCATLSVLPQRCALFVIEDGSSDRTLEILQSMASSFPLLRVISHPGNRGYGRALRTGVEYAGKEGFDYAVFMDSYLTNDPVDIPRFIFEMRRGTDVIKASRFRPGGRMQGVPFRRSIVSRTGNLVAQFLFGVGVRDCTNGFRAVRVAILERMNLRENGFPVIAEELYQAGFLASTYAEVPVVLTSRKAGQRPTSFSYRPATLYKYFSYGLKARFGVKPLLGDHS